MSVALAAQLREGTKKSHTMAENTGFVSCFLKGVVDKASYRKLVADPVSYTHLTLPTKQPV